MVQQVETAQFVPKDVAPKFTGQLVYCGRSVGGIEWDALDGGTLREGINPWGAEMSLPCRPFSCRPFGTAHPRGAR